MTALGDVKRRRIDELAARAGQVPEGEGGVSLSKSAFRRLRRDPVAILGAIIVVIFLLVAAFAPLLAARDPLAQSLLSEIRPGFIPGSREGVDPLALALAEGGHRNHLQRATAPRTGPGAVVADISGVTAAA